MATLLSRQAIVAGKIEVTEGTAETLAGTDALLVYDVAFTPDVATFERTPARSTLSKLPSVRGVKLGTLTFRTELKGSGSVGTAPEWDEFLQGCGFAKAAVSSIAIGAVTGGPFQAGETITGGTSSGTGRVVGDVATGASVVTYVPVSGTLQSGEVLTGGTSGATATTSGSPTASQGFEFKPASSSVPSLTLALFLDGIRHLLVGARGNVTFSAVVGEPGFMEFTFTGVYSSTTDVAMPTATYDTTVPPVFLGVGLSFHGFSPVFTTLEFDLGNTVEPRRNANDSLGAKSAIITGRSPTATVDPELDLVANFDFFGKLRDGSQGRFACSMGSTAGNKVTVASPKCQIDGLAGGDRNGIATASLTLNLATSTVNTGDDELQIGVL